MRRRGATGVGIFGLSSLLALVLSTQLELSLGWAVLTYVIFQTAPILVFERSFVHRCPACDTPLESMLEEAESDTPAAIRTHCPTCDVDA